MWRRWVLCLSVGLVLGTGCATGKVSSTSAMRTTRVELDPMLVKPAVDEEDEGEAVDVNELFERAYKAFTARRFEDAAQDYATIVRYFPETRFFLPSAFNAGLAYEKLGRWEEAVSMYRAIIEREPRAGEAKDAYYRGANALAELERWDEIEALMTQVLLRGDLSNFDRVEAHVRRSKALLESGQWVQATNGFQTAIDLNARAEGDDRLAANSHYIVQSHFGLGRALHLRVNDIKLVLPPERMGEDLKQKADIFLRSQYHYIKALGFHHPKWSMAAGYMIGRLYQDFYNDIFMAEIPDDLGEEGLAMYFEELREQIRPLMVRAVQVYKKNLSLSKRIGQTGVDNRWVADTEVQLERMEAYLEDEATQRRAERFARRGQSMEEMWRPMPVALDWVEVAVRSARREMERVGAAVDEPERGAGPSAGEKSASSPESSEPGRP